MKQTMLRLICVSCLATWLGACTINTDAVLPDNNIDYKREKQAERNLEVPPDLTSGTLGGSMAIPEVGGVSASYQDFVVQQRQAGTAGAGLRSDVLPEIESIAVQRDGDVRWLLIQASPDAVWPRVVDFWQQNGILLQEQDPTVGVMRTAWLENRANIKRDFLTDNIRKVFEGFYETSLRDQYRVRLEQGRQPGTTELYLTHYGMQEVLTENTAAEAERTVWTPRERDPGLEAEMLRRLMVFLGSAEERAQAQLAAQGGKQATRSELVKVSGGTMLLIDESFDRAWRLTGLALDRVGFAVEDRDRTAGIYYVRYQDPGADVKDEGWLSKLAFWSDDQGVDKVARYRVKVSTGARGSEVTVLDDQGQPQNTKTAERILTLIHEQIR
jgi:outer membrane protein assembly factor BamC